MTFKLFLFGTPRIEENGRSIELNLRKGQALLAYLVVEGSTHSRDQLAAMFWPESDQSSARASLRRTLYQVNKAIGNDVIEATAETMALSSESNVWLDTAEFTRKTNCLKRLKGPSLSDPCYTALTEAAALQHDPFLSGFSLPDCPDFNEWIFFKQEALRQTQLQVLQALVNHLTAQEKLDRAIEYGRQWLDLDPHHDPAHRTLMTLYAKTGQKRLALRQYEECKRLLKEAFDIEPASETIQLYEEIKGAPRTSTPSPLPAVQALLEVGFVDEERPSGTPPHNLAPQLTPFVGREAELADLDVFIQEPAVRLINLIGPGGMGKTRLALALGQKYITEVQDRFPDGIFQVPLSPLTESGDIIQAIAGTVNIQLSRAGQSEAFDQLKTMLKPKQMLLILDNFEHLLEGGPLLVELLRFCPGITILVTSRERLYIKEEHLLVIKGLEVPDVKASLEEAADYPAVKLFATSVRRNRPSFTLTADNRANVVRICQLVAGMPLALELAASWTDILTLAELVEEIQLSIDILETELRNIPARQRSIRAVFDTSWQRLETAEQEICAQLSLFVGGFTRQAAQRVAVFEGSRRSILSTLSRLSDKSLIQYNREARRYQIHDLLRQYAAEQLELMPALKAAAEERFYSYFADFLYERREAITSSNQGEILGQISADLDNLRLVWRRSLNPVDLDIIKKSYYTLYQFGDFQGYFRENTNRIEQTIGVLETAVPGSAQRDEILAVLYTQLGYAYIRTGPLSEVEFACRKSLALFQALNQVPPPGFGTSPSVCLGLLANIHGRFSEAQKLAEKAIALLEPYGQPLNLQIAYYVLNEAVAAQGEYMRAFELAQKALQLTEATGNRWMRASILVQLGNISLAMGQLDEARSYYQASYEIKREFNDPEGMAAALNHLGHIAWRQESYREAERYFQRGLVMNRNINDKGGVAISLNGLGETAVALGNFDAASTHFKEGLALAAEIQFTTRLLWLLTGVARLYLEREMVENAAEILGIVRDHPAADRQMREMVDRLVKGLEIDASHEGDLMAVVRREINR